MVDYEEKTEKKENIELKVDISDVKALFKKLAMLAYDNVMAEEMALLKEMIPSENIDSTGRFAYQVFRGIFNSINTPCKTTSQSSQPRLAPRGAYPWIERDYPHVRKVF